MNQSDIDSELSIVDEKLKRGDFVRALKEVEGWDKELFAKQRDSALIRIATTALSLWRLEVASKAIPLITNKKKREGLYGELSRQIIQTRLFADACSSIVS